jgi:ribosome assembly protein YihI (activator of Der GTPase)
MTKLGGEPQVMSSERFAGFVDDELARIGALMKRLNIVID